MTDTPKLDNALARLTCGACLSPHPCCCPPDAHLLESVLDRYRAARDADQLERITLLYYALRGVTQITQSELQAALINAGLRLEYR
mgnify:CR=1 FL=1